MRLKFLFLLVLIGVKFVFGQPLIKFSQTRGCIPYQYTIDISNNGFCLTTNPNFRIDYPGGTETSNLQNFTSQPVLLTISGISNVTITCTTGTLTPLGIFPVEGLSTTSGPDFSISSCEDLKVTVNLKNAVYDQYEIVWGDGLTSTVIKSTAFVHTYSDQVQRNIKVTGFYEHTVAGIPSVLTVTSCRNDSAAIANPYPSLSIPGLTQLTINNLDASVGQATLEIVTDEKLKYKISKWSQSPGYQSIDTIFNVSNRPPLSNVSQSVQIGGLNTLNEIYCFKIEAIDDCGNIEPPTTNASTEAQNQMCSLPLVGRADTIANTVTVAKYFTSQLTMTIDGVAVFVDSVVSESIYPFVYKDENVVCGIIYTYRAQAKTTSTGINQLSISAPLTILGLKKSPLAVPQVLGFVATVGKTDEKTTLSWRSPTIGGVNYNIYLEATPKNKKLGSQTDSYIFIPSTLTGKCYLVEATNQCGISNIVKACPPYLQAQKDNMEQNSIKWENAVVGDGTLVGDYQLEFYKQGGGNSPYRTLAIGSNNYIHNPIDTFSQVTVYRVYGTLPDGTEVRSAFVAVKQDLRIFMPSAFTPNDDGLNDIFVPGGLFWSDYELTIYNRWGQTVFATLNKWEGWNGSTFNPDLYHYIARVKDQFGEEITKKGTFQLIR